MNNFFSMSYFIPKPPITEQNCPDQAGRVFIVTGGYTGLGYELTQILYSHNATVYIAGRAQDKASKAIATLGQAFPGSKGRLEFLKLDLADLTTIKPAAETFLGKEQRLDVLVNNAGVYAPEAPQCDEKTSQGHDLQIGTNCLGHLVLYKLLEPILQSTAQTQPRASVRVLWAASVVTEVNSPTGGGMRLDRDGAPIIDGESGTRRYGQSKVGCCFLSGEFAAKTPQTGIVHLAFNPGNCRTELQRNFNGLGAAITDWALLHPPVMGAYTELWAALAPEVTLAQSGKYVWPWGRWGSLRRDIEAVGLKSQAKGGLGLASRFLAWAEKEVEPYV